MDQDKLSKIWGDLVAGSAVEGWWGQDQVDKHILVPLNQHITWERVVPSGEWIARPGMWYRYA